MNVLIVSDSHGLTDTLQEIKQRHDVSAMIHCGDSELDMDESVMRGFVKVGGNVDFDVRYPTQETVEIGGLIFFITHGHLLKVNSGLLNLANKARENDANIVCYGHTHIAGAKKSDHQIIVNPGSIKQSRGKQKESYAILSHSDDSNVRVDFYQVDGTPNANLSGSFDL